MAEAEMDPGATRLFVTKVPPQVGRDEIAEYFSRFGATTDVYVPSVPGAAYHKGMAFVSFSEPASLQLAMGSGPHEIGGQEVVLDVAAPKGAPRGGFGGAPQFGAAPQYGAAPQVQYVQQPVQQAAPAPAPTQQASGDRIFVTKVPPNIDREQLRVYFEHFGELTDIYMPSVPGGATHKGICFVSFADPQSVQACLAHQPHEVQPGCQVVVDVAAPRGAPQQGGKGMMPMQQAPQVQYAQQPAPQVQYVQQPQPVPQVRYIQQPAQHFKGGQAPQPRGWSPAAAGRPQQVVMAAPQPMNQGASVGGAIVPGRLFLTRVPPDVTTADLQAYFEQYGQLQDVFIPNGGKGIAFVSFADQNKAMEVLQTRQHIVKEGQYEPLNVEQARDRPAAFGKGGPPAAPQFAGAPRGPMPRSTAPHYAPY